MAQSKIFVADLVDNQTVETSFLVAAKSVRETRKGDPYLALTLQDKTGSIEARAWENADAMQQRFDIDDFIILRGRVSSYRGELQITVSDAEKAKDDSLNLSDFLPHSRWSADTLFAALEELIENEIKSPEVRRFLEALFADDSFKQGYLRAPAAVSNHHNFLAGLLEHSLSMARLAVTLGRHYEAYYPNMVDTDLVVAGAIIHDMGKIEELSYGRSFEYSTTGRLIGHIALGSQWVARTATSLDPPLDPNLAMQLQHLVLSHHGRQEYGSPITPRSPEAMLLHELDMIDSRMNMCWNACGPILESAPSGDAWSDYQRPFNGSLYISGESAKGWRATTAPDLPTDAPGINPSRPDTPPPAVKQKVNPDTNLNLFGE